MKHLSLLFCLLFSALCASANAVDYCAPSSWGYAGNVTGGGNATPTLVKNESELSNALNKKGSVIIITEDITVTNHISSDKSNLTIMALPGLKLISNQQNKDNSGILYLKGNNLLLRNLTLIGPGAYDCNGWDLLCLDKATNVWVDHCDFQDGCDGNFDIKSTSDNITVTWCRFRYLKEPKAGGSGGSDDHRFSNLVGSGSTDKPDDGTYNITYGFCWWDEGCKQRMTRCRNALIHYLNCYWNSSVADYYIGPENVSSYFEGCTFAGKANSVKGIWNPFKSKIDGQEVASVNYCTFVGCTGNLPSNSATPVTAPAYAYETISASAAKTMIINSTCGAGATLTVTSAAEVSSSCSGGDDPTPPQTDLTPVTESTWWNFSDEDFNSLGTISSNTIVRNLLIAANANGTVIVDGSNKTIDGIAFTSRLKLGGTGSSEARHLQFIVTGPCSITAYLVSSSSSSDRVLNVASGTFDNVVGEMSAPGAAPVKQTYDYTGGAASIYLYSPSSGVNLYGVRLTYSGTTDIDQVQKESAARKVLRNGQVLILRGEKSYNLLGKPVE